MSSDNDNDAPFDSESSNDDDDDDDDDILPLELGKDSVKRDTVIAWMIGRFAWAMCWASIIIIMCLLGFTLVYAACTWAITELEAVSEVYSVDCSDAACAKKTYRQGIYNTLPCSRIPITRCVMVPTNWVFIPMLPVYQWVAGKGMFIIRDELPILLRDRCRLCFGTSLDR